MNSSELSSVAGVTIRALRHYHHVGVLDEPPRSANGYRQYTVHHLIRVLRIRRLAALSVPLDEMPGILDETGPASAPRLDCLDAELAAQIERLTAQRALIAQLRDLPTSPDLPPELARHIAALTGIGSPAFERMDRDQTVLLAHLLGDDLPHLVDFYARLNDPDQLPSITRALTDFQQLGDNTSPVEVDAFVDRFVATFSPGISELRADAPHLDLSSAAGRFDEYSETTLNATQRRALELIGERLDGDATG